MWNKDNSSSHGSEDYDLDITKTIPYYESFHNESLKLIRTILNEPGIWLDTGCGTGTLVQKALEEFNGTFFILADPSVEMLNKARIKLVKYPHERFEFLKPTETGKIVLENDCKPNVITAIQSHHYMSVDERFEATKICYRLLDDNGVYITFENIRPNSPEGLEIGMDYWKNFQTSSGRDSKTVEMHLNRFDVEYFPIKIDEHISLLKKSGFRVVEIFWISYMHAGFYCIK